MPSFTVIPVVAIARVVLDAVEIVVDGAELLADALDEGADVDPIPLLAPAGHEAFAAHEIVDLAIGEVALGHIGQGLQDRELRQGEPPTVILIWVLHGCFDPRPPHQPPRPYT